MSREKEWVIGIDIGGTQIKAGLVDNLGRIFARSAVPSPDTSLNAFGRAMTSLVNQATSSVPPGGRITGVGIGCKGIIDPGTSRVRILPGPFRFLEGERLDRWVERAAGSGLAIRSDNDAKAALVGETRWGVARGKRHVVLLTLGSGVGGAILSDGKLVRGRSDIAGHLGHVTVDFEGPVCLCGNRGCLEAIFSARAIEGDALAAIRRGCETRLHKAFAERPAALTCLDVFSAARAGDKVAQAIVRRAASALAATLAGLAHALDPELFVLGGQIAETGRILFGPVRREFFERTARLAGRRIPIRKAALGAEAGLAGAAALAWHALNPD
jgi:glucokinase